MDKKIAVISVSSILLVAAVIGTVTYSVTKYNNQNTAGMSTSSKAAHSLCQSTDYKDTCEKSLANVKADSDPTNTIQVAFSATIDGVKDVLSKSSLLKEAAKDPETAQAFDICQEVLGSSIDDIQRSIEKLGAFDKTKLNEYVNDLETWLSGAITYQETCLDAFENTTGDTGEKMKQLMKTTSELSSNGLAMVSELSKMFTNLQIPGFNNRRLLEEDNNTDYYNKNTRRLMEGDLNSLTPNVTVAQDGSGQFKSIQEAINTAPKKVNQTFVILVKAGVYHEYVIVPKGVYNVFLLGEGPTKTVITGDKSNVGGVKTFRTPTLTVEGDNFIAKDIGIENTAGASKGQAVAVRVSADKTIFYNCQIDGHQDTLYAHAHRQYYRDCTISGTIDFIFGDAESVFQNCKIVVRKPNEHQGCMVTAQGRKDPRGKGSIVLQNCTITAEQAFLDTKPMPKAFLGRPWKLYSRALVMQSYIDSAIAPEGWSEWAGNFALDTLSYSEYQNRGPGSIQDKRVKWSGIKQLTPEQAESFTLDKYVEAATWVKSSGVPYEPAMMQV